MIASSVSAFMPLEGPRSSSRGMSNAVAGTPSTHSPTFERKSKASVAKRMNTCNNSLREDDDASLSDMDNGINDENRRSLFKTIIASSSAITGIIAGNPHNAYAEEEDLLEIDQKKVVMQVDAKNIPQKYGSTQQSSSTSTASSFDDEDWMTQMEKRRIDIFEKAAPSVVFIDTYVESRDAFSTNV